MHGRILIITALGTLAGCDDGNNNNNNECRGHSCPDATINLPEGGEIRLELVNWKNNPPEVRTHAWFASDQAPATRPFPRPPTNWEIQDGPDLCRDMRTGSFFPAGSVDSRTYMDVGEQVAFVSGDTTLALDRALDAQDNAGYGIFHDILYISDLNPADVVPGTQYDFSIAGNNEFPAVTFPGAMIMPPDTTITFPQVTDHFSLRTDEDLVIEWDTSSTDVNDYAFLAIDDLYGPVGFCFGPQSGRMTIPASFIATMPKSGNILFGLVNHQVVVREDDNRRMDFIGINCQQAKYVVDTGL